jgi:hypothetical protein
MPRRRRVKGVPDSQNFFWSYMNKHKSNIKIHNLKGLLLLYAMVSKIVETKILSPFIEVNFVSISGPAHLQREAE